MKKKLCVMLSVLCCMVCVMQSIMPVKAATVTDEEVAKIKARNMAYRNNSEVQFMEVNGIKSNFGLIDLNGDGNEELLVSPEWFKSATDVISYWNGKCYRAPFGSFNTIDGTDEIYYCKETGFLLNIVELKPTTASSYDKIYDLVKMDRDTGTFETVVEMAKVKGSEDAYLGRDESGYFERTCTSDEVSKNFAMIAEAMPSKVLLETPYEFTTENLDKYLPIDEAAIRADLIQKRGGEASEVAATDTVTRTLIAKDNKTRISGNMSLLPEGTVFIAETIIEGNTFSMAKQVLEKQNIIYKNMSVFDFSLVKEDGTKIHEFADYLIVQFALPENMSTNSNLQVYRLEEDGKTLTACETSVKDGTVSFKTNHFSTYILVEKENVLAAPKTGEDAWNFRIMLGVMLGCSVVLAYMRYYKMEQTSN